MARCSIVIAWTIIIICLSTRERCLVQNAVPITYSHRPPCRLPSSSAQRSTMTRQTCSLTSGSNTAPQGTTPTMTGFMNCAHADMLLKTQSKNRLLPGTRVILFPKTYFVAPSTQVAWSLWTELGLPTYIIIRQCPSENWVWCPWFLPWWVLTYRSVLGDKMSQLRFFSCRSWCSCEACMMGDVMRFISLLQTWRDKRWTTWPRISSSSPNIQSVAPARIVLNSRFSISVRPGELVSFVCHSMCTHPDMRLKHTLVKQHRLPCFPQIDLALRAILFEKRPRFIVLFSHQTTSYSQIFFTHRDYVPDSDIFFDYPTGCPNPCCTEECEMIRFPRRGINRAAILPLVDSKGRRRKFRRKEMCNWIDCDICFGHLVTARYADGEGEGSTGSVDESEESVSVGGSEGGNSSVTSDEKPHLDEGKQQGSVKVSYGHICGKCRLVRYCSQEHQFADWPEHKRVCTKVWNHHLIFIRVRCYCKFPPCAPAECCFVAFRSRQNQYLICDACAYHCRDVRFHESFSSLSVWSFTKTNSLLREKCHWARSRKFYIQWVSHWVTLDALLAE